MGLKIHQTVQGDQEPVCTHCGSRDVLKKGRRKERQMYQCRLCRRISFGLPPDRRPTCLFCKKAVWESRMPDGRSRYFCPACGKSFLSEYKCGRPERGTGRNFRHRFCFWLNRQARLGLGEYVQAHRCTDAQAVRAIFRHVLTGEVFSTGSVSRAGRSGAIRVRRDPRAAAMKFPSLVRESARQKLAGAGGHYGRGFQKTIIGVQIMTVLLDDEAKEGLVHAMNWLQLNHADAARWLLANVRPPGTELKVPLRPKPATPFVAASTKKPPRYEWEKGYDPDWND